MNRAEPPRTLGRAGAYHRRVSLGLSLSPERRSHLVPSPSQPKPGQYSSALLERQSKHIPFPFLPKSGRSYLPSCTTSLRTPWRRPVCSETRGREPGEHAGCGAAGTGLSLRLPCTWRALSSASPEAVRRRDTWAVPEASPAPAGWPRPARFGSRLAREDVLFLRAATPCSPGFTRKTGFHRPVTLPHPLWGSRMNFSPFQPYRHFTHLSPSNFSRRGPPPVELAPRPALLAGALEYPATSSHLPSGSH